MSDIAIVIGGLISSFGLGWGMGRFVKAIRQFFDSL